MYPLSFLHLSRPFPLSHNTHLGQSDCETPLPRAIAIVRSTLQKVRSFLSPGCVGLNLCADDKACQVCSIMGPAGNTTHGQVPQREQTFLELLGQNLLLTKWAMKAPLYSNLFN